MNTAEQLFIFALEYGARTLATKDSSVIDTHHAFLDSFFVPHHFSEASSAAIILFLMNAHRKHRAFIPPTLTHINEVFSTPLGQDFVTQHDKHFHTPTIREFYDDYVEKVKPLILRREQIRSQN